MLAAALLQELEAKQRSDAKAAGTAGIGLAAGSALAAARAGVGQGAGLSGGMRRSASATTQGTGGAGPDVKLSLHQNGVLPAGGLGLPQELNTSRSRSLAGGGGGTVDSSIVSGLAGGGGGASAAVLPNVYLPKIMLPTGSGPPAVASAGPLHAAARSPPITLAGVHSQALLPLASAGASSLAPPHSARQPLAYQATSARH